MHMISSAIWDKSTQVHFSKAYQFIGSKASVHVPSVYCTRSCFESSSQDNLEVKLESCQCMKSKTFCLSFSHRQTVKDK